MKNNLRIKFKEQLKLLDEEYKNQAAKELLITLMPLIKKSTNIGIYHAYGYEISLKFVIEYCNNTKDKQLYQPIASKNNRYMYFDKYSKNTDIFVDDDIYNQSNKYYEWYDLDLILLPVLAVDKFGFRLGKGGGYYDFTLQNLPKELSINQTILCGVGYRMQMLPDDIELPYDNWDVRLNYLATDKKLTNF